MESKGNIFVGCYLVDFLHVAAPTVDAANTPHSAANSNHRPAGCGEFLHMAGLAELLGRVGDGGEGIGGTAFVMVKL